MTSDSAVDMNRQTLRAWLRDAHAMERGTVDNLERLIRRTEGYPDLRAKLQVHLAESRTQVRGLEECLHRLDAAPSLVKDTAMRLSGRAEAWISAAAPDDIAKNCLAVYAYENFEIAAYMELAAAAEECREPEIKRICEEMLENERAFANWLAEHLPEITRDYLQRQTSRGAASPRGMAEITTTIRENPMPALVVAVGVGVIALAAASAQRAARPMRDLRSLYIAELQELRSSEVAMERLLARAAESAAHGELRSILLSHRDKTHGRQQTLQDLLRRHDHSPRAHRDQGMAALVREANKMLALLHSPELVDAGIIASVQRLIHHQIAAYGATATWAGRLGFNVDQQMLHDALESKKRLDARLTAFAETIANPEAVAAE